MGAADDLRKQNQEETMRNALATLQNHAEEVDKQLQDLADTEKRTGCTLNDLKVGREAARNRADLLEDLLEDRVEDMVELHNWDIRLLFFAVGAVIWKVFEGSQWRLLYVLGFFLAYYLIEKATHRRRIERAQKRAERAKRGRPLKIGF